VNVRLIARLPIIVLAVAAATAGAVLWLDHGARAAPSVTFTTIEGEPITPHALRGKVVLVNFWATSCEVCVKEMPQLAATYERHRARGFETVAVAMRYDPPNRVLDYARRAKLPFRIALDPMGELERAFGDIPGTPTTYLVDRTGRIVKRFVGAPDFAALDRAIEAALRQD
jgi:peroxiredoxin